jgi:hypothetical protein
MGTTYRHAWATSLAMAICLGTAAPALAAAGDHYGKLLSEGGPSSDLFAHAVAIDGTIAVVGAPFDDENGWLSGSAYLYDVSTGAQTAWLLAEDGEHRDRFGWSVAIEGATVVIGAPATFSYDGLGSAFLFDAGTGEQTARLMPDDGTEDDLFGYAVSISGTTALIGALYNQVSPDSKSGAAYLFDTSTGEQLAKLLPEDGAELDFFGYAIALNESTVIVGAPRVDDDDEDGGAAYLFEVGSGRQIAMILPDNGEVHYMFGDVVAISGSVAVVGSALVEDGYFSGIAYLFESGTNEPCEGDSNGDGRVDIDDLVNVALDLGTTGLSRGGDLDGSGLVDNDDLILVVTHFGLCAEP